MTPPKFLMQGNSFHSELRKRINDYFSEIKKEKTGNHKLFTKAIILVAGFLITFTHLVFFTDTSNLTLGSGTFAIFECVILAILTAAIGFNIMHDGAHGSFSKYKWINNMAGLSLNFLGANVFMWTTKHNVVHHTFTNIDGVDDDIDARPFLRLCESQKHYKMHRYQHLYFWMAYSLLYLYWIFVTDYRKYFTGKVGSMPIKKMTKSDHLSFWGFKAIHAILFIALPIYKLGFLPWLTGFLVYGMFAGLVISMVFQLAHTVEDTHFPVPEAISNKLEDEWAVHQLRTTANFATKNKIVSWFTGGLNFQIEHHLFPQISHIHYPDISQIIKKTCDEYSIKYIEYTKTRKAIASHVSHLRQMGKFKLAH